MIKNFRQLRLFTQIIILALVTILIFTCFLMLYANTTQKIYENKSTEYTSEISYQLEETIVSNYSFLSKIIQFISYHVDVQNFLLDSADEEKYPYYRQMITNLTSIMTLNPHILDIIIRDNYNNRYSLIDMDYELPDQYDDTNSIGLSSLLYNKPLDSSYFVIHYPINSISTYLKVNEKIGDVYLVLNDTAFLDQSDHNYNKTSSEFYLMDSSNQIFWTNTNGPLPSLSDLTEGEYRMTQVEGCGLTIVSLIKQEDAIYGPLGTQNYYLLLFLLITVVVLILWVVLIINIISPLNQLVNFISCLKQGDLGDLKQQVSLEGYREITIVAKETNEMLEQIDSLTHTLLTANKHLYKQEIEKKQAELNHLRSQINPHFLYNTLECIKGIAAEQKQPEIVAAAKSLAMIFKYSVKGDGNVPFRDEVKIVKSYISIQKMRFEDRFHVEYDINPNCYDFIVPKMILQPLIENAIVHGIEGSFEDSRLLLSADHTDQAMIIKVNNTGLPIEGGKLKEIRASLAGHPPVIYQNESHGIGICNVNERIKLLYGKEYGLSVESNAAEGTTFIITLPASVQERSNL